jgi:hypothetical protein
VTEARPVSDAEFFDVLHDFEYTAFRLELQDSYAEPREDELYAAYLRGEHIDPTAVPELAEWFARIAEHVHGHGKRVGRVRVQRDPATDYQRFERSLDRWNIEAGETMRYMTVVKARGVGLLPAAGNDDWWLLDSSRLLVMRFDGGRRLSNELISDPSRVLQACKWRDLAVHHSTRATSGVAA